MIRVEEFLDDREYVFGRNANVAFLHMISLSILFDVMQALSGRRYHVACAHDIAKYMPNPVPRR